MRRARRKKRATARALYDEYRSEVVHNAPMPTLEEVREVVRAARARHMQMQASAGTAAAIAAMARPMPSSTPSRSRTGPQAPP